MDFFVLTFFAGDGSILKYFKNFEENCRKLDDFKFLGKSFIIERKIWRFSISKKKKNIKKPEISKICNYSNVFNYFKYPNIHQKSTEPHHNFFLALLYVVRRKNQWTPEMSLGIIE